ncbi:hypothetical protein H4R21_004607 [Coemansia helicoidea]|uniref:Uncharacterized protein n=1 Tax=Coemansia helicoidea TaxID=1286919 RepID=A0ACC1KXD4_9FUNG|nr:hypothetical protein H4R21_004607 [Coemansia helicoidea]
MSAHARAGRTAAFSVFADPQTTPATPAPKTSGAGRLPGAARPGKTFVLSPHSQTAAVKENFDPITKELAVYRRTTSTAQPLALRAGSQQQRQQQRQREAGCPLGASAAAAPVFAIHSPAAGDRELDRLTLGLAAVSVRGGCGRGGPEALADTPCQPRRVPCVAGPRKQQRHQSCLSRPPPPLQLDARAAPTMAPAAAAARGRSASTSVAAGKRPEHKARPSAPMLAALATPPNLKCGIR